MIRSSQSLLLLAFATTLAGCNSTDSLYSQGPWGPRDVRRSYPQYSSPWGRHPSDASLTSSADPNGLPGSLPPQGATGLAARFFPEQRIAGLPADPLPSSAVVPPAVPAEAVAPAHPEVPNDTPSPAPRMRTAPAESPPGVFSAPRRASSYAGTWKAKDEKGNTCLIHLSSATSLDHYKASTSKCSDEGLRSVSTWSFDQNEVALFSRGMEVARLSGSEAALNGSLKAGIRIDLSR